MKSERLMRLFYIIFAILLLPACVKHNPTHATRPTHKPHYSFWDSFFFTSSEDKRKPGKNIYKVGGKTYKTMNSASGYREKGIASWYGKGFHNHRTSSGEHYNMYAKTAAHRTLPLNSYVKVTNLKSRRSVVVRINDRGPFHSNRLIDLSYAAARDIGMFPAGMTMVELQAVSAPRYNPPPPRPIIKKPLALKKQPKRRAPTPPKKIQHPQQKLKRSHKK